jgi:hypothetical protein
MGQGKQQPVPTSPPARNRTADFWTSLVLLVLAAGMAGGALSFPLRGTYAGVRNAWYVSPALLPLIVAACLAMLALTLLLIAIRAGAARTAFRAAGAPSGQLDVLLIAGLIVAFVVGFVPRVDFIVGAAFFLLAFTVTFHFADARLARLTLGSFFGTAVVVALMALSGLTPEPRSTAAMALDAAVLAILAVTSLAALSRAARGDQRRLRQCLAVALATPLLLGSVFKFLLLVPLPREGLVVIALDSARYAIRAAL